MASLDHVSAPAKARHTLLQVLLHGRYDEHHERDPSSQEHNAVHHLLLALPATTDGVCSTSSLAVPTERRPQQ